MKDIFVGLAIFGQSMGLQNPETAAMVLTGNYDSILLKTFFWTVHKREPINEEHTTNQECIRMLDTAKDRIRGDILEVFRMVEAEAQMSNTMAFDKLRNQIRLTNKPHELGTVNEIATKFKISKSEVRRRKAAGATTSEHFESISFP